jgi:hypothetical protein
MRFKACLAAPVLLARAYVTKKHDVFSMGPKLSYPTVPVVKRGCRFAPRERQNSKYAHNTKATITMVVKSYQKRQI